MFAESGKFMQVRAGFLRPVDFEMGLVVCPKQLRDYIPCWMNLNEPPSITNYLGEIPSFGIYSGEVSIETI